jgi:NADPH:quinone reductase-like Zn-dependent oxidoreductase
LTRLITVVLWFRFASPKLLTFLARPSHGDLVRLRDLVQAGKVRPVIDRCFSLREVPAAIRYLEGKHAQGKVVIRLEDRNRG